MLQVVLPRSVASPAAPLVEFIPHALVNIAPERTAQLNELIDGYTLEIRDDARWVCEAVPHEKRMAISTFVLEILWAQAYAVWVFYQRVVANKVSDGSMIQLHDPEVAIALDLYRWALNRFNSSTSSPWPSHLPKPEWAPVTESAGHIAQELALVGAGHMLLHEVAHIALKHDGPMDNAAVLAAEQDADVWAADWVFADAPREAMIKRSVGVSLKFLSYVSGGVYSGWFDGVTHPRHFDRLYNSIAHRVPADVEEPWAVIVAVLSLHFTNAGLPSPTGEFDDFVSAANAFFDVLADLYEGR